jgi:hypothetical protein
MLSVQRKAAVFLSFALILALSGCGGLSCNGDSGPVSGGGGGGGGGAGGPILSGVSFTDAFMRPVSTNLASGSDLVLSASGLAPSSTIEALVFGPGEKVTLPTGESVCGYIKLSTSKTGSLPATVLMQRPMDGSYQVKLRYAGTRAEEGVTAITVAPEAGRPNLKVGTFTDGAVTETQAVQVGLNLGVSGTGFASSQVDLYVVEYDPTGTLGGTLFDISGFVSDGTIASGRGLEGTAETVTVGADGTLPPREVWRSVSTQATGKTLELVVDVNRDGKYDSTVDYRHSPMLGSVAVIPASDRSTGAKDYDIVSDGTNPRTLFQSNDMAWVERYAGDKAEINALVGAYVIKLDQAAADQAPLVDVSGPGGSSQPETWYRAKGVTHFFTKVPIYMPDIRPGEYAVVLDMDGDGLLDRNSDVIDGFDGEAALETVAAISRQKWTVMVYVDADNDLEGALLNDLDEMEIPQYLDATGESQVTVCVQFDRTPGQDSSNGDWTTTRRFIMATDSQPGLIATNHVEDLGEQDMGDPNTLRSFVDWAKDAAPADRYMLIINSHGNGPRSRSVESSITRGVGFDMSSGNSLLTPSELSGVLRGVGGVDVLGFDACLMGSVEVLAQLHGLTDYVIASELLFPGTSYDYATLLTDLVANPDMTPRELAIETVDSNRPQYASTDNVVLTAYDMAKVPALVDAIRVMTENYLEDQPGDALSAMYEIPGLWSTLLLGRSDPQVGLLLNHDTGVFRSEYDDLVDLGRLMAQIKTKSGSAFRGALAGQVVDAMNEAKISQLISRNRASTHTGLSVWLPGPDDYLSGIQAYRQLTMSRQTKWDEIIGLVLKARGVMTFSTTPVGGPYNGMSSFISSLAEVEAANNNLVSTRSDYGLIVGDGTTYVITDLPLTEDVALGYSLNPPTEWESPPRWRIEVGFTVAHFQNPFSSILNKQASTTGWYDREGILWNQWFPFKITKEGGIEVLNRTLSYGL